MISNQFIILILISIVVSLFVSSVVTLLLLRFFSKTGTECLPSIVEHSVHREMEKQWLDYKQKLDNVQQKLMQEQVVHSSDEVIQTTIEEEIKANKRPDLKKEKSYDHRKNLPKKEKRESIKAEREDQFIVMPDETNFINLGVSEGRLVEVAGSQPSYYRAWESQGQRYYEFFCDEARLRKAMFNRAAVIDPYCDKQTDSVNPDEASNIETMDFGLLDKDFNIIKKTIIKYSNKL